MFPSNCFNELIFFISFHFLRMFNVPNKNNAAFKILCLKHNANLSCSYFLILAWEGYLVTILLHTLLSYSPWTQVSSCHLPTIFYYYSRFLSLPSFLPTHSAQSPTEILVLLLSRLSKLALSLISLQKYVCVPSSSLQTICSP